MSGVSPVIRQIGFRARSDSVGLNVNTWDKGAQNEDFSQNVDEPFRLRLLISDTVASTKSANRTFGLEFRIGGTGGFTAVGPTTAVQGSPSAFFDDDALLTPSLLSGGQNTFVTGRGDTDGTAPNSGNITLGNGNDHTEVESCLIIDSAQVSDGNTIEIQATGVDATPTQLPTITVVEGAPPAEASGSVLAEGSLSSTGHIQPKASGTVSAEGSLTATGQAPGVTYEIFRRTPQTGAPFDPQSDTPLDTTVNTSYDDLDVEPGDYDYQVFRFTGEYSSGSNIEQVSVGSAVIPEASGAVAAEGSLSAVGHRTQEASGTVSAEGSLEATGHIRPQASGTVSAVGSLSAVGQSAGGASGTVAAEGSLTATGHTTPKAAGSVAAEGSLSATGNTTAEASGQVVAEGSLTATGRAIEAASASGSVSAEGSLAATGHATPLAAGSVTAEGSLFGVGATPEPEPIPRASGSISAQGSVTGSGYTTPKAFGSVASDSRVVAVGYTVPYSSAIVEAVASLNGVGRSSPVPIGPKWPAAKTDVWPSRAGSGFAAGAGSPWPLTTNTHWPLEE